MKAIQIATSSGASYETGQMAIRMTTSLTDNQAPHLPYRDELARLSYLLATQSDNHSEEMLRGFWGAAKNRHRRANFDIVEVRQLYMEIGDLSRDFFLMEKMNRELVKSFRIVMPVQIYMQRMADHVLADLLYRDRESSRQVFQLLMERLHEKTV